LLVLVVAVVGVSPWLLLWAMTFLSVLLASLFGCCLELIGTAQI
jgi:hypothetical protein